MNSGSEGQQRAHRHTRTPRLEKGGFLKYKRKDQSGTRKWAGWCRRLGWRWCFRLHPSTSAGRRRRCSVCCSQGDLNHFRSRFHHDCSYAHTRGSGTFTFLLCPAFLFGVLFFFSCTPHKHIYTRRSRPWIVCVCVCVCVIFMKMLPSTLNTKCSGNSGGRTRGFGVLSAFTPAVEAPG